MKKITPHLWFDKEAKEAASFYTSIFENSKITHVSTIHETPSGDCDVVSFELAGQPFMAINAGPMFKINPSISFQVKCKTKEEVDAIWAKLSIGGTVLMELGSYPFNERFGWVQDKFGVSWQVMLTSGAVSPQKITPMLMFTGAVAGKAEEAMNLYTSVFKSSSPQVFARYGKGEEPDREGTVKYAQFMLNGMEFAAMDSARGHKFGFNEAISLLIPCNTQEEINYYADKLSAVPDSEQCGWVKDKYGVSWQVWAVAIGEMMERGTREQVGRMMRAMFEMERLDIAALKRAFEGK